MMYATKLSLVSLWCLSISLCKLCSLFFVTIVFWYYIVIHMYLSCTHLSPHYSHKEINFPLLLNQQYFNVIVLVFGFENPVYPLFVAFDLFFNCLLKTEPTIGLTRYGIVCLNHTPALM